MSAWVAPCSSSPDLFASIFLYDHYEAREVCSRCLSRVACAAIASEDPEARGTYAGELYRDGELYVSIDGLVDA